MEVEAVSKLAKAMSFKAPVAMNIAEELIEGARGPSSELEKLQEIFSTDDALLGLSSIGSRVEFSGK